jgi:hypothetical protein
MSVPGGLFLMTLVRLVFFGQMNWVRGSRRQNIASVVCLIVTLPYMVNFPWSMRSASTNRMFGNPLDFEIRFSEISSEERNSPARMNASASCFIDS